MLISRFPLNREDELIEDDGDIRDVRFNDSVYDRYFATWPKDIS
jgi:hypothetical protein